MLKKVYFLFIIVLLSSCAKSGTEDISAININNLQEYLEVNSSLVTKEMFAYGKSVSNTDQDVNSIYNYDAYISFYNNRRFNNVHQSLDELMYFESEHIVIDENDFTNYKRRVIDYNYNYTSNFFTTMKRHSNDPKQVWAIVTYKCNGILYKSNPIKIQVKNKPIEYIQPANISINTSNKFKPKFSWLDGIYGNSEFFVQLIEGKNGPLSSTLTENSWLDYKNSDNVIFNFSREIPWQNFESNEQYSIVVYGLDNSNWANLKIHSSFMIP